MKLRDLDASFLRHEGNFFQRVATFAEAHGVVFLCPKCFGENGGAVGTHSVICWRPDRVPLDAVPGPGRWFMSGTSLDDLSLHPSVNLTGAGCKWHGWVKNGEAT